MSVRVQAIVAGVLFAAGLTGCAAPLPPPQTRSVIVYTGERILPSSERMAEVEAWLQPVVEDIGLNPTFLIRVIQEDVTRYPWDALDLVADTADVRVADAALDGETPYMIYAFLRLMQERDAVDEWIPEAEGLEGFQVEEAIVSRIADVWLLGRSVFDTQPFGPMDELLYAKEFGYLTDFLLATQGDRFTEAADQYREANPDKAVEFRDWFLRTFERDGPGYLRPAEADSTTAALARPARRGGSRAGL